VQVLAELKPSGLIVFKALMKLKRSLKAADIDDTRASAPQLACKGEDPLDVNVVETGLGTLSSFGKDASEEVGRMQLKQKLKPIAEVRSTDLKRRVGATVSQHVPAT
jgi:hypothetical protein